MRFVVLVMDPQMSCSVYGPWSDEQTALRWASELQPAYPSLDFTVLPIIRPSVSKPILRQQARIKKVGV